MKKDFAIFKYHHFKMIIFIFDSEDELKKLGFANESDNKHDLASKQ